ncbi:MAG: SEC-C domain-containing protein [Bacilli bacterium]|nr:SEC-C domain-containing protein [Bacilli bacterium]
MYTYSFIYTDNTNTSLPCGSGKKYKNCCGRNQ